MPPIHKSKKSSESHSENSIYISCTIGIYYPKIRKIENYFIDDHLIKYPIIGGSISHFSSSKKFMSELYTPNVNDDEIIGIIIKEIQDGAFSLISKFPTLLSIYEGITNKHPYFKDYYDVYSEREKLTNACIVFSLWGLEKTLQWIENNLKEGEFKSKLKTKFLTLLDKK